MTTLNTALVLVHLVCMAALVGGYFVAVTQAGTPNPVMVWGARLQLLSGVALMGVATVQGGADQMWLGIKLLIALAVVACVEIANARNRDGRPVPALVHVAGGLALVNVVIGAVVL